MFKKYKAFIKNEGAFAQPGAKALQALQNHRINMACNQEARAHQGTGDVPPARPPKPKGPKCPVCFKHPQVSVNPWQSTKRDLVVAELSDDSNSDEEAEDENGIPEIPVNGAPRPPRAPRKPVIHGLQLASCKHYFCGACLAHHIYRCLNLVFDTAWYGTVVKTPGVATPGRPVEFPISCPACQVKPGEQPVEISDVIARLVLGEANMDEWNHARFLSTLNLIYCPHKGCDETFDADVAPAPNGVTLVQCPRCRGSLCKVCKSVWHENLTCAQYQALPITERAPEDVAFATLAAQKNWRRCPKCSAIVELKFGCNHITCICKHHFCYTCGADFEHTNGKYRCKGGAGCKVWEE